MYFTENRYDRSIEWMMKGVPNFYPRGSGIVVTGNFRYTAEMCDCGYCGYYGGKHTANTVNPGFTRLYMDSVIRNCP